MLNKRDMPSQTCGVMAVSQVMTAPKRPRKSNKPLLGFKLYVLINVRYRGLVSRLRPNFPN